MENQKMRNYEAKPNYRHVAVLIVAVLLVAAIPILILSIYAWSRDLSLKLVDNLMADSTLRVEASEDLAAILGTAETVEYTWEKSVNNGDYVAVEAVEYAGHGANIGADASGQYLNVALDDGELSDERASVAYRLRVDYATGGASASVTSEPFYIPYYDELRNGSFEVPQGNNPSSQYGNDEYTGMGGIWRSTSEVYGHWHQKNVAIEIVNTDKDFASSYSWYGDDGAYAGVQFAELNCESAGALYQDVLTLKGESLNYWLAHRARGASRTAEPEYDTMYLVIMPTQLALTAAADGGELDTQEDLAAYLAQLGIDVDATYEAVGSEELYAQNGVLVVRVTSSDQAWQYLSAVGGYVPTSGVTRFFFVAGHTASGNNTVGNFLDEVGFSQAMPPVRPEQFSLQIEKVIAGVEQTELEDLIEDSTLTVAARDATGREVETALDGAEVPYAEMHWSGNAADGWTGTYTIANQPIDENVEVYTVTDPETTLDGYQVESTPEVAAETATSSQDVTVTGGETAVASFKAVLTSEQTTDEAIDCAKDEDNCGMGGGGTVAGDSEGPTPVSGDGQTPPTPQGVGAPDTGANQVIGTSNATTALALAILVAGGIALLVAMAPRLAGNHRAKAMRRQEKSRKQR